MTLDMRVMLEDAYLFDTVFSNGLCSALSEFGGSPEQLGVLLWVVFADAERSFRQSAAYKTGK